MLCTLFYSMAAITTGGFLVVMAWFGLWRSVRLRAKGVQVKGRVVDYYVDPNGEGAQYPVVEFIDLEGTLRRVKLGLAKTWDPAVGGSMSLVYDPDDPTVISEFSGFAIWIVPLMFAVFGGFMVFMGVFPWILTQ